MRRFAELYERLDSTTSTNAKVALLTRHFESAPPEDACWALFFLSGRRFKRLVGTRELRGWALEVSGLPEWLFEDSYAAVGDLAETVALLVPTAGDADDLPLSRWIEERILPLRASSEEQRRDDVLTWWRSLPPRELFLLNKMLTGALRVGVSSGLVTRALASAFGVDRAVVTHRLAGSWEPSAEAFFALGAPPGEDDDLSRPYPFFLASPLESEPGSRLGDPDSWQAEWKWDGIRGQLVRRDGRTWLWSRGEELITEKFPEVVEAAETLPDGTVLDGEILAWSDGRPLSFAVLQRRIGRKRIGPKTLADAPVSFLAYDVLEHGGRDVRDEPLSRRRALLDGVVSERHARLLVSPVVDAGDWSALAERREQSRRRGVEGLMKRLDSPYRTGRVRGDWWKWKVEPHRVDAVLVYAQAGHGRRSNLYTDYTFAVWDGEELRTLAKAYSGLNDAEIRELDRWIRRHTVERFGPVRSVEPQLVFELAFEGLAPSKRHSSGLAVRFPRISRWRRDKPAEEADTLETVQELARVAG